jgi:hypothetical protein
MRPFVIVESLHLQHGMPHGFVSEEYQSMHSSLPFPSHRSAKRFIFGLLLGNRIDLTPELPSSSRKPFVNAVPRSWTKSLSLYKNPASQSTKFRAICFIHSPLGSGTIPTTLNSLIARRITKRTWYRINPRIVQSSVVKESVAGMTS